jgi:hypothetical protein
MGKVEPEDSDDVLRGRALYVLTDRIMKVNIISTSTGRGLTMTPRDFGKLLHVARLSGWQPERLAGDWPGDAWNTQIVLPHIGPYLPGAVSYSDADDLCKALRKVAAKGDPFVRGRLYLDLLMLIEVTKQGGFMVHLEDAEQDPANVVNRTPLPA